jgi:hypothetical protein
LTPNSKLADRRSGAGGEHAFAGRFGLFFTTLLLVLVLGPAGNAAAQTYKVETVSAAAPQELAPAVREVLSGDALRVVGPNGPLCEIWLRKVVPGQARATQELGITYGQLAEGTLVGAIRFPAEVKDYRRQRVNPGVYTLRYALLPVDGNHLGVAPQRDFLLAAPAAADQAPTNLTRDPTIALGRKTTGTNHPSVWSMAAVEGESASLPVMTHQEDSDLWVLEFRVQVQSGKNAAPSAVSMALVVAGYAPEA